GLGGGRDPDLDVADVVLAECCAPARSGLIVVLRAYCDESGTHAQSPWSTMAAWVSDQSRWKHLSTGWRRVLAGPPPVREAKATDMEARQGEFAGWSAQKVLIFRSNRCH